ncbi:hypothetical protein [Pantoea dispersa]|uniref:hypothetical protein n=1 Tax=Pantoea dispersa TaxID=59814 RepID=UPI0024AE99FB|nr:hypothetical protein [Pantoea dispersa]MDI6634321.1 hypothetical protein [Pantoea dispersa]
MNEVKRYKAVINDKPYKPYAYCEESSDGIYVRLEDYTALQEQLTATTNSLTNAQEALKSAGIEADTVQAGVMGLKAQRDALAAENAALKQVFVTREFSTEVTDVFSDTAVLKIDGDEHYCHQWVDNDSDVIRAVLTAINAENPTPATDAYLNAVRAEGLDMAAAEIDRWVGCDLLAREIRQKSIHIRAGNAGKDGE